MDMEHYRHTQVGTVTIVSVGGGVLLLLGLSYLLPHQAKLPLLLGAGVLVVCLFLFPSLTVVVDDRELVFWFGAGLVRKRFYLSDVKSCEPVRNALAHGWGIHLTPHGWLYNVSGLFAVEVGLSSGSKFRLGTDEPEGLCRAISAAARLPASLRAQGSPR
jgi:hypothetical protein